MKQKSIERAGYKLALQNEEIDRIIRTYVQNNSKKNLRFALRLPFFFFPFFVVNSFFFAFFFPFFLQSFHLPLWV